MPETTRTVDRRARTWRRCALAAAALGLALSGIVAMAPAAHADPACPYEYACFYAGLPGSAWAYYPNAGNFSGELSPAPTWGYVWNNGAPWYGADHIELTTRTSDGTRWVICLHYGPQNFDSAQPTAVLIWPGETVTGWTWRGECAAWEDTWRRY